MMSPLGAFLCPPGYAGPTGLRALARESSAVTEAARFLGRTVHDRATGSASRDTMAPTERGLAPVLLVPGFMAGDVTLALMATHLRRHGHRTYRSRMHANVGCTQDAGVELERRVEEIAVRRNRRVALVGHSLGGLLARGLAAKRPDLVAGIVTLGSPILAPGAAHTVLLWDLAVMVRLRAIGLRCLMGTDCTSGECARLSWEQSQVRLPDGFCFTSVFSRRDGIVDWRSCLDPQADAVEVATSHTGMAWDPGVLDVVAGALGDIVRRKRQRLRDGYPAPAAAAG
jgi:pimeloyl-ACP methyl ester carboxylesterase